TLISSTPPASAEISPLSYTTLFRSVDGVKTFVIRSDEYAPVGDGRRGTDGAAGLVRPAQRERRAELASGHAVERGVAAEHGPCRSEEHTSELQSRSDIVCRLLLEKK